MTCFSFFTLSSIPASAQSDLYNRLSHIERDIQTLSKAVYKGEKLPNSMIGAIEDDQKHRAQIDVQINDLETQIRNLRGNIEQLQYSLESLNTRIQDMSSQNQVPTNLENTEQPNTSYLMTHDLSGQPKNPIIDTPLQTKAPTLSLPSNAIDAYEQAFSLLKNGDNVGAQDSFILFLETYPEESLAHNARYWLGETYYVQNNYDKSARVFADAYQKSPKGSKAADNLLKLGLSLVGLGRQDDACVSLSQLNKEFGQTSSAVIRRGEQERTKLGCE